MSRNHVAVLLLMLLTVGAGCGPEPASEAPRPRPVTVMRLSPSYATGQVLLTGSVGSWKTEELGFEVAGRVQFVAESETDVEGETFGFRSAPENETPVQFPLTEGQLLAQLDATRYELAVKSVQAQIETAVQQKAAVAIEVTEVLPAQQVAARADLAFRNAELARGVKLVESRSISKSEYDKLRADRDAAQAKLSQLVAQEKAKQAEEASLAAKITELEGNLENAKRDVKDCELRSPFRGQIAKVHVIPGAFVERGQPVVTVQMMDPIKVEVEVSAATSKQLSYRDIVFVMPLEGDDLDGEGAADPGTQVDPDPEGTSNGPPAGNEGGSDDGGRTSPQPPEASVYTVDPVADARTRTFTVTCLLPNEKLRTPVPPELGTGPVPRAEDIWRFIPAPFVKPGAWFLEMNAIHFDGSQAYVWKIINWREFASKRTSILQLEKVNVVVGTLHVRWLGLFTFREVQLGEGASFDLQRDRVAGKLSAPPLPDGRVLFDRQRWRYRPGDLVGIQLEPETETDGFSVPMRAIYTESDRRYVFIVNDDGTAEQRPVVVSDTSSDWKRITAASSAAPLSEGMRIVIDGAHYLVDGERVTVASEVEPPR